MSQSASAPRPADGTISIGATSTGDQMHVGAEAEASLVDSVYGEIFGDGSPAADADVEETDEAEEEGVEEEEADEGAEEGEEEEEEEVAPAKEKAQKTKEKEPEVLKVAVDDGTGRREIDVDLSDKKKLMRYVQQAHGAMKIHRRWQADKAALEQERAEKAALQESVTAHDELMAALEEEGEDAFIKKMTGRTLAEHIQYQENRARWLADPKRTPVEIEALLKKEAEEAAQKKLERERSKLEKEREVALQTKEQAENERFLSVATPAFNKYRFAGKLGDKVREHKLDSMFWKEYYSGLDKLRKDGVQVTPEIAARAARDARDTLGAVIVQKAEKLAEKKTKVKAAKAKRAAASVARQSGASISAKVQTEAVDSSYSVDSVSDLFYNALHGGAKKKRK